MGVLNDLWEITQDVQKFHVDMNDPFSDNPDVQRLDKVSYSSIAKQAKQGVMQFPVVSSRALSYDCIHMIAKASERNFSSFLQVIFTMNQITNTDNPQQFIKQYHQNIDTGISGPSDIVGFVFNAADVPEEVKQNMQKLTIESSVYYDQLYNLKCVNDIFKPKDTRRLIFEAKNEFTYGSEYHDHSNNTTHNANTYHNTSNDTHTHTHTHDSHDKTVNTTNITNQAKGYNPHQIGKEKLPTNIFVDNDAKKCNELVPTLMHVRILKDMGADSKYIDFIVGVKAMIHPVTSEDMVQHLVSVLNENGMLFKFIKWTTGEINFFKDLIFNVDQIKGEIRDFRSGDSSTWWSALKNIKATQRFHKWTRTDPVLPNTTLVVSMEEVDFIKANYGFDLMEERFAAKIMSGYSLLQFVVVDASSEVAHFYIDGQSRYNTVTFKGLEKQTGDADKQFKDILKAVNKLQ